MKTNTLIVTTTLGLLVLLSGSYYNYHALPVQTSTLFSGSGNCALCHSKAPGTLEDTDGRDISPLFHWQSSMMANAAKDPLWQAKVSAESAENPHIKDIIEDKCTTCHAPMGRTEAKYKGAEAYSLQETQSDALSLDGVSCTVCHQIQSSNLDTKESYSGGYLITDDKLIFGPYDNPTTMQMINNTGYTPSQGQHISSSALCATCHTLITPFLNSNGEIAGYFPEQMPYYEWKNSIYPNKDESCQKCHMPHNTIATKISSRPGNLATKRTPIFEHHFVGGNKTMNRLIKSNITNLGIESSPETLDTTNVLTDKQLANNSIDLALESSYSGNQLKLDVYLKNKTGHKFPTGFPSRIAWLHVKVSDSDNNIVFESGKHASDGTVNGIDELEQHYDTITKADQVQVYQAVMGNTDNQVTYTLLRGAKYLKDNRIPPEGFTYDQPYDSLISVIGKAYNDVNFNRLANTVGTGSDIVTYLIETQSTEFNIEIELCYQTLSSYYYSHLKQIETAEVNKLIPMFESTDVPKTHVISGISSTAKFNTLYSKKNFSQRLNVFPNPANNNSSVKIEVQSAGEIVFKAHTLDGKLAASLEKNFTQAGCYHFPLSELNLQLPGVYIVTANGFNNHSEIKFTFNRL